MVPFEKHLVFQCVVFVARQLLFHVGENRDLEPNGKVGKMKLFERLMNAVTFAEAGLPEVALEMLNEDGTRENIEQRASDITVTEARPPLSAALDRMHEAVTFAEAGEQGHAQAVISAGEQSQFAILVLSHNDAFAPRVREYAIDFAGRQEKGIVALNVMETPRGSFFRREGKNLFEQFRRRTERSAEVFQKAAEEKGVDFVHLTTQGSVERAIRIAHEKNPGIQFVVTDPFSLGEESASAETISVFSLARQSG
jgi:nucleotide-binding universal stress UspA family protein